MTLLLIYVGAALAFSFVCSILEATLLSSRVAELNNRKDSGDRGAALLLDLKQGRLDDAIGAILTLNTFAHSIGAALAGDQAGKLFGSKWVGAFAFVLTILVLVFTEIIPKTLGTVYASRLVGPVARVTHFLTWVFHYPLIITRFLTRLIARGGGNHHTVSRGELRAMVAMAARDGQLAQHDSLVLSNVLRFDEIFVEDVMTPRTVINMLPVDTTVGTFMADKNNRVYSRIPLFDKTRDRVTGFVLQRDVLIAAAEGTDPERPIRDFARSALFIPEGQPVGNVLRRMIDSREHMALVTDEYGGISGLVTLEDLVETTLGVEIVDESDRVADLRLEAARLREERLAGMRRWREKLELATGHRTAEKPPAEDAPPAAPEA